MTDHRPPELDRLAEELQLIAPSPGAKQRVLAAVTANAPNGVPSAPARARPWRREGSHNSKRRGRRLLLLFALVPATAAATHVVVEWLPPLRRARRAELQALDRETIEPRRKRAGPHRRRRGNTWPLMPAQAKPDPRSLITGLPAAPPSKSALPPRRADLSRPARRAARARPLPPVNVADRTPSRRARPAAPPPTPTAAPRRRSVLPIPTTRAPAAPATQTSPPAPKAAPKAARARAPADQLAAQVRAYRRIRQLQKRDPEAALPRWRRLRSRWPDSAIAREIELRIIQTLMQLGRTGQAQRAIRALRGHQRQRRGLK